MIILTALLLATEIVGMVVNNLTQASDDTNTTQLLTFEDPSSTARQRFAVSLEVLPNEHISELALSECVEIDFWGLCLTPYTQYIGTRDLTPAGRHDLSIKVTEASKPAFDLTTKYAMSALFLCFVRLLQVLPRPGPLTLGAANCEFGLSDLDSVEIKSLIGRADFLPGPVQDSATSSSGSNGSVLDIGGVDQIKQRANAAAVASAGASSNRPDQDTIAASLNATGGQESSSFENLTSHKFYNFKLNGDGAIILPDQLLVSVLEASIDRASQPRDGPINARTYTPQVGNYIVHSRGVPGLSVGYPTVPCCFFELLRYLRRHHLSIREGDWTCNQNFRDVLLGRFTLRPDANAGIAASLMGEAPESVDVARRDYK